MITVNDTQTQQKTDERNDDTDTDSEPLRVKVVKKRKKMPQNEVNRREGIIDSSRDGNLNKRSRNTCGFYSSDETPDEDAPSIRNAGPSTSGRQKAISSAPTNIHRYDSSDDTPDEEALGIRNGAAIKRDNDSESDDNFEEKLAKNEAIVKRYKSYNEVREKMKSFCLNCIDYQTDLQHHYKIHWPIDRQTHRCPDCSKKFTFKKILIMHKRYCKKN